MLRWRRASGRFWDYLSLKMLPESLASCLKRLYQSGLVTGLILGMRACCQLERCCFFIIIVAGFRYCRDGGVADTSRCRGRV